jgi:excisionase family DNA binding protein
VTASIYTPATLAAEWQCSAQHVRNLIDNGELRAFRLGGKLLRIPAEAVTEFLCRKDTLSGSSKANAASCSTTTQEGVSDIASVLATRVELKRLRQRSTHV